jgi:hypothetical protein
MSLKFNMSDKHRSRRVKSQTDADILNTKFVI